MSTTPTPEQFALAALVASGFVTQAKVDEALALYQDVALTQGAGEAVEPVAWMDESERTVTAAEKSAVEKSESAAYVVADYTTPLHTAQQIQQAVARALAERDAEGGLWAVNVQGPDDVYPCESRLAALEMANTLNASFIAQQEKDHHEYDPIMRAVVIPWEHSPEEHAAALRERNP